MRARAILALSAALAAGCGESGSGSRLGTAVQPIAGGYPDSVDTAVVAVLHGPSASLCTGSLIAPNLVLTARHCVSTVFAASNVDCAEARVGEARPADGFFVSTAPEVEPGSVGEHLVDLVLVLPGADDALCGRDLAAVILKEPIPPEQAAPLEVRLDDPLVVGELYSAVGYGATDGTGSDPGLRRRRDELAVECLAEQCASEHVAEAEWLGTGGVCHGDSGGPALDAEGRVIGVTSRGEVDCGLTIYGSTLSWAGWIRDAGVCAAGAGLYDPPVWTAGASIQPEACMTIGQACSAPPDCATEQCLLTPESGYCTRSCSEAIPCPEGYRCEERNGRAVCVRQEPAGNPLAHAPRESSCNMGATGGTAWPWVLAVGAAGFLRRRRFHCSSTNAAEPRESS